MPPRAAPAGHRRCLVRTPSANFGSLNFYSQWRFPPIFRLPRGTLARWRWRERAARCTPPMHGRNREAALAVPRGGHSFVRSLAHSCGAPSPARYTHVSTHTRRHTCVHTRTHTHHCSTIYTHVSTLYIHVYVRTYMCIYVYTHTCVYSTSVLLRKHKTQTHTYTSRFLLVRSTGRNTAATPPPPLARDARGGSPRRAAPVGPRPE